MVDAGPAPLRDRPIAGDAGRWPAGRPFAALPG